MKAADRRLLARIQRRVNEQSIDSWQFTSALSDIWVEGYKRKKDELEANGAVMARDLVRREIVQQFEKISPGNSVAQ